MLVLYSGINVLFFVVPLLPKTVDNDNKVLWRLQKLLEPISSVSFLHCEQDLTTRISRPCFMSSCKEAYKMYLTKLAIFEGSKGQEL